MSAQIRTQYFGPEFMQATQIYRCRSVMRKDDMTNQQDDRPSGQDNMTLIGKTTEQVDKAT